MKLIALMIVLLSFNLHVKPALGQSSPVKPAEWDKVVEAGRKEGKVVVLIPASVELRKEVDKTFKQRFGIEAELVAGRAAAIVGKIMQEAKAGTNTFDLHLGGSESMVGGLLAENLLEPFEPAMLLPEVRNP